MCGIAGIFSFYQQPRQQLPQLMSMTLAMKHRGPDDEGYLAVDADGRVKELVGTNTHSKVQSRFSTASLINSSLADKTILAMGHRRLSIMDVSSAGHQPMGSHTGRYWIIYNGEIYNFQSLRCELEALGHRFQTSTDTEVILAAYSEWREECLVRFNGDFAFALWDNKEHSLFCARDRIGIKPFYYIMENGQFIFGSDIKTLQASGLYRPEPDPQGLYLAMAFGIAPRPITAFKGVRALEQSHWIRLHGDGQVEKKRYWHIPVGTQESNMTEKEAVDLLEEKIERAIGRRLVADVPVGTFMSGGIDSTLVSAIAARQHPGIKAFTLGYQSDAHYMDEVPQAEATAKLNPMQHIIERVDPDNSLSDLNAWIAGYEEPFHSLAANFVISKLVKNNKITVVLNGLGGDELFAGYDYYRFHQLPHLPWLRQMIRHADKIPIRKAASVLSLIGAKKRDHMHTILFRQFTDLDLRQLLTPALHPPIDTVDLLHNLYAQDLEFQDSIEAMSYMDLMNYIGNHHVHRVDQFTMAHSVEGRFPFLDHEVVELAYRIPSHLKIRNGIHKYVLRKVAKKYIAPECLSMNKKGFGLPLEKWIKNDLKDVVQLSLTKLRQRDDVVNPYVIDKWFNKYREGSLPSTRLWHLVALELWFEQFIDPGIHKIE